MPQLLPFLDQLVAGLPEDSDQLLRFLSLYQPPAFLTGCSQLVHKGEGTYLIRNYDYAPDRFAATIMRTNYLQPVLFMVDCIWGALDGINAAGLSISLAFGGEPSVDVGFGIPIIVRYLLETCHSVAEAQAMMPHLPSHMCYNLTLADSSGAAATVFIRTGGLPIKTATQPLATNHQEGALHRPYHQAVGSFNRERFLVNRLRDPRETVATLTDHFLAPPLYCRRYEEGFGTLYTARYHCEARTLTLLWPGGSRVFELEGIGNESFVAQLGGS